MSRLNYGQPLPPLDVAAVGGGTISLPDDLAGSYGIRPSGGLFPTTSSASSGI
jgi:hypothetical protein